MPCTVKRGALMAAHDVAAGGLCHHLAGNDICQHQRSIQFSTDGFVANGENDLVKIFFAENPALVVQIANNKSETAERTLREAGVKFFAIGTPINERAVMVNHQGSERMLGIDYLRDVWMRSSYLLDCVQSGEKCAAMRYENYKKQPLRYRLPKGWNGKLASRNLAHGNTRKAVYAQQSSVKRA